MFDGKRRVAAIPNTQYAVRTTHYALRTQYTIRNPPGVIVAWVRGIGNVGLKVQFGGEFMETPLNGYDELRPDAGATRLHPAPSAGRL